MTLSVSACLGHLTETMATRVCVGKVGHEFEDRFRISSLRHIEEQHVVGRRRSLRSAETPRRTEAQDSGLLGGFLLRQFPIVQVHVPLRPAEAYFRTRE